MSNVYIQETFGPILGMDQMCTGTIPEGLRVGDQITRTGEASSPVIVTIATLQAVKSDDGSFNEKVGIGLRGSDAHLIEAGDVLTKQPPEDDSETFASTDEVEQRLPMLARKRNALWGSTSSTVEQVTAALAESLLAQFVEHDSSYLGIYFKLTTDDYEINVQPNEPDSEGYLPEPDFADRQTLVYLRGSTGWDELVAALNIAGLELLRSEEE